MATTGDDLVYAATIIRQLQRKEMDTDGDYDPATVAALGVAGAHIDKALRDLGIEKAGVVGTFEAWTAYREPRTGS